MPGTFLNRILGILGNRHNFLNRLCNLLLHSNRQMLGACARIGHQLRFIELLHNLFSLFQLPTKRFTASNLQLR